MKRLQVLFLAALSSSLLLFGCGKKDAEASADPVVEMQPQTQDSSQDQSQEAVKAEEVEYT